MALAVVVAQQLTLRPIVCASSRPSAPFRAMAPRGAKGSKAKAASAEDAALALLTASANEEVDFVKAELDKNPALAPPLAKLIRSGSLMKALTQSSVSEGADEGKMP